MQIEVMFLKTAEEAFNFLSPAVSPAFSTGTTTRRWLFRGQSDANFKLLPTALRPSNWELMNRIAGRTVRPSYDSTSTQLYYEFNILAKFYSEVDAQGLPVADDIPKLRKFLHRPATWAISYFQELIAEQQIWPPKELRGLAALAQHHGLPTRLLDWSYDPFVACYFACQPKYDHDIENFVIWALDSYAIERSGGAIEIVHAPASSNPNLHAQRGVFTINPISLTQETIFGPLAADSVDELLSEVKRIDSPFMYKILVPRSESHKLLSMVNRIGYRPSTLFPGYEGAAKSVLGITPIEIDDWHARITILVPEDKLDIARAAAALLDPYAEGHQTFTGNYKKSGENQRYLAMSTQAPKATAPLIRQIAESINGSIFFFQHEGRLVDTNTDVPIESGGEPLDFITQAGFFSEPRF